MGMKETLWSIFRGAHLPDKAPLDRDEEGKTVYKEDVAAMIQKELARRKSERLPYEMQWTLNMNFLMGNQYCTLSPRTGAVVQEDGMDTMEREVFNRISPIVETRIANLKKMRYAMRVLPRTSELDDYEKAEVSTAILRHKQTSSDFFQKTNTALYWNELCGNVFWISWWNKEGGRYLGTAVRTGADGSEHACPVFEGDVDYALLPAYEIYPESIYKEGVENQSSILLEQVKSVEEIRRVYGVEAEGKKIPTFHLSQVSRPGQSPMTRLSPGMMEGAARVVTYMEKPSRLRPEGRMAVMVEDALIYYGRLPYESYPISQVTCKEVPGHFFGKSVIEDLIPLQRAYNAQINAIHEYTKRASIGGYFAEEGSVDLEEFRREAAAVGGLVEYAQGFHPPTPMVNGSLPGDIWQSKAALETMMEYVAGVSQLMVVGDTPQGVTSGTAIAQLQEIDHTRLAMTGDHHREAIRRMAKIWLSIYKTYAKGYRAVEYMGKNALGSALLWQGEDINSYDVEFTTENELIYSEEVQKENFFSLLSAGMYTDADGTLPQRVKEKAVEIGKAGNYSELLSIHQLQAQRAMTENRLLSRGVLPEVWELDDHSVHLEEHKRYALQENFWILRRKSPALADAMLAHIHAHMKAQSEEKGESNVPIEPNGTGTY